MREGAVNRKEALCEEERSGGWRDKCCLAPAAAAAAGSFVMYCPSVAWLLHSQQCTKWSFMDESGGNDRRLNLQMALHSI